MLDTPARIRKLIYILHRPTNTEGNYKKIFEIDLIKGCSPRYYESEEHRLAHESHVLSHQICRRNEGGGGRKEKHGKAEVIFGAET